MWLAFESPMFADRIATFVTTAVANVAA